MSHTSAMRPTRPASETSGLVVARGRRLFLRALAPTDLKAFSVWAEAASAGDIGNCGLVQAYRHVFEEDPSFYDRCLTDDRQIVLMVVPNGGRQPVGLVRFFDIGLGADSSHAALETLVVRAEPGWLEFALEAACLACRYGLAVLGLRRIDARVPEDDPCGIRILQRLGFHWEGALRQAIRRDDGYRDVLLFGLLADEARGLDPPAPALVPGGG